MNENHVKFITSYTHNTHPLKSPSKLNPTHKLHVLI